MAALREEMLRMSLLKVSAADFVTRNLSGNGQDGDAAAMTIVEAVDQVQVPGTAASGANRQFPGEMRFGAGRERRRPLHGVCEPIGSPRACESNP